MIDILFYISVIGFHISACFSWYYAGKLVGGSEVWKIVDKHLTKED